MEREVRGSSRAGSEQNGADHHNCGLERSTWHKREREIQVARTNEDLVKIRQCEPRLSVRTALEIIPGDRRIGITLCESWLETGQQADRAHTTPVVILLRNDFQF